MMVWGCRWGWWWCDGGSDEGGNEDSDDDEESNEDDEGEGEDGGDGIMGLRAVGKEVFLELKWEWWRIIIIIFEWDGDEEVKYSWHRNRNHERISFLEWKGQ